LDWDDWFRLGLSWIGEMMATALILKEDPRELVEHLENVLVSLRTLAQDKADIYQADVQYLEKLLVQVKDQSKFEGYRIVGGKIVP
jgi:hypothetical protein